MKTKLIDLLIITILGMIFSIFLTWIFNGKLLLLPKFIIIVILASIFTLTPLGKKVNKIHGKLVNKIKSLCKRFVKYAKSDIGSIYVEGFHSHSEPNFKHNPTFPNDSVSVRELLKNFEDFKLGIQVSDKRSLKIDTIYELKNSKMYALFCNEIDSFIKLDKKSFDKAFKNREVR